MEKILFASDIHGSAFWCEKLIQLIEWEKPDKICLLGDLLYHGPRNPLPDGYDPQKVAALLNGYKDRIVAVRGNCDAEVDQLLLDFPARADYTLLTVGKREYFLTHGHLFDADNPPALKKGDVLVNGHFHVPQIRPLENGAIYLNCGSVALPKDSPHTCCIVTGAFPQIFDLESGRVHNL